MEVGDTLADDVVDRDECAVAAERGRHARRNALHSFEEWSDQIVIEVDKSHTVLDWCDEDVSLENG